MIPRQNPKLLIIRLKNFKHDLKTYSEFDLFLIAGQTLFVLFALGLTVVYVAFMWRYIWGWLSLPFFQKNKNNKNSTTISILIPARNEEENLPATLQAVLAQNYPTHLYEIIVIDDFSTDNTPQIIRDFSEKKNNIKSLKLADYINPKILHSFKKKAIEIGVQKSENELIVQTDADCVMGDNWLKMIADYYEKHQPKFIAAPVIFFDEKTTFQRFQSLDFIGMMGVNGAGIFRKIHYLCNGANLAYEREIFHEVNGFEGIDQQASGDDLMLLQKIAKKYPDDIGFLKNTAAATYTTPKRTLREFMQQRIRWATKTTNYPDKGVTFTWALIWLFCISIPINLVAGIFIPTLLWMGLAQLAIKVVLDFIFLRSVAISLDRKDLVQMSVYIPSIFLELTYVIVIGLLGLFIKKYEWKGRKVQ